MIMNARRAGLDFYHGGLLQKGRRPVTKQVSEAKDPNGLQRGALFLMSKVAQGFVARRSDAGLT